MQSEESDEKKRGTEERDAGTLVRIFNKSAFGYIRSWYTLWLVDFDSFCQQWSIFHHREKCDMAVMTGSTSRHAEFELATNTALSDFPNVEAKREEQRNCLKHVVGRIDVFAISPTGFGKSLIFQLFPRIKRALEWRQDRILIFDLRNFDLFARKIINVWRCNTSLDWQVKTTYSWCGLSGRKSLFKTNLTGVPSPTSPHPSLLFFLPSFLLRNAPHYLNAWNRLLQVKWSKGFRKNGCWLPSPISLSDLGWNQLLHQ